MTEAELRCGKKASNFWSSVSDTHMTQDAGATAKSPQWLEHMEYETKQKHKMTSQYKEMHTDPP